MSDEDVEQFISIYNIIFRIVPLGLISYIFVASNYEFSDKIPDNPFISDQKNLYQNIIQCKCGENINNEICTKEQEILGCISLNNNNTNLLRNLEDKYLCLNYYQALSYKENISEIFNLNFKDINKYSLLLLIFLSSSVLSSLILLITALIKNCNEYEEENCFYRIIEIFGAITLLLTIINLVVFILFWISYTSTEITEYLDMFDCPDINIDSFTDQSVIDKIDDCILAFIVLNLYSIIISLASSITFVVISAIELSRD